MESDKGHKVGVGMLALVLDEMGITFINGKAQNIRKDKNLKQAQRTKNKRERENKRGRENKKAAL